MRKTWFTILLFTIISGLHAQGLASTLLTLEAEEKQLQEKLEGIRSQKDSVTLLIDLDQVQSVGLLSNNYLEYKGYYLEYSEEHEQGLWTMHILNPNVVKMGQGRTNDFRKDPRIATETADSIDYFTHNPATDVYTGYGFDRGHLVPSADFRWSKDAMSSTYYYSNISPQRPQFNRGIWAELEGYSRSFVINNNKPIVIIAIPIFGDNQKIKESINGVTIPTAFAKAILDLETKKAIGFILKNEESKADLSNFIVTIDKLEEITGYDLFNKMDILESSVDEEFWFPDINTRIHPLKQNTLPKNHFNTVSGAKLVGINKEVWVCGNCIAGRESKSGNLWINLDDRFPNAPVSGMIKKNNIGHFEEDVLKYYMGKNICIKGKVANFGGGASVEILNSHYIKEYKNK